MILNKTILCILIFWGACVPKPQNSRTNPYLVKQYHITFKKDTTLLSESFYNSAGALQKELYYFEGTLLNTTVYINKDSFDMNNVLSKSDKVIYVSKSKDKESRFINGKVSAELFYDSYGNVTKVLNYDTSTNTIDITEELVYSYDKNGKKTSEVFLWNKDTVNVIRYKYDEAGLLYEKYYVTNKCCDRSQPIPNDKILYEYNDSGKLAKDIQVIDRSIKRKYKDKFKGYFDQTIITTYSYDDRNKLIKKKVHVPTLNTSSTTNVNELFKTPDFLSEEYLYEYSY